MSAALKIWEDVKKIRTRNPLIHNITNFVVMNNTANALLALGASPVMAHAKEEVENMVEIANALVINIGTLSQSWIHSMQKAVRTADKKNVPWILDPVGAGATKLRSNTSMDLMRHNPAVIRGNASEIMSLAQTKGQTKGVDSIHESESAYTAAQELAHTGNCVVCISGKVDIIVNKTKSIRINNGHELMPKVTGLGCTASALVGAFLAVNPDPFYATAHAMAVMGIAGQLAAAKADGPGTMQLYFIDALYQLDKKHISDHLQLETQ